jgi:hypothetical protein
MHYDFMMMREFACIPVGWIGLGEDRDSMAAFLFTWPDGDTSQRPLKLPKVGGAAQAVLDRPETGPVFGPDGLKIPLIAPDPKRVCSLDSRRAHHIATHFTKCVELLHAWPTIQYHVAADHLTDQFG